ncbi:hypothetical protein [Streptomyces sp. DH12]|uniref:hypothetical protein n=1 Tax=Streptomyces sp. DH12 TaxID=2857010 RepID=UPI001E4E5DBD|nr:hypothetical protein [Streptomyces sp. DH12]
MSRRRRVCGYCAPAVLRQRTDGWLAGLLLRSSAAVLPPVRRVAAASPSLCWRPHRLPGGRRAAATRPPPLLDPHRWQATRLRARAGGVLSADSPGTRPVAAAYPWSATKEAMRVRAAFQLIVCSLVDQDWMSSM